MRHIRHKPYTILPGDEAEFERYWLAGYLEGEGAFTYQATSSILEVNIVDRDVIECVQRIWRERYAVQVNIHRRPPRREGYQPQFHLAAHGAAARAIMADIAPMLGTRRRARVAALLAGGAQRRVGEVRACYDVRRAA